MQSSEIPLLTMLKSAFKPRFLLRIVRYFECFIDLDMAIGGQEGGLNYLKYMVGYDWNGLSRAVIGLLNNGEQSYGAMNVQLKLARGSARTGSLESTTTAGGGSNYCARVVY
jgi:hypothetical protein